MTDEALRSALNRKIQDSDFTVADIPDYLTVFRQLANEIDDLQDEVEGWNRCISFDLHGAGRYWISVNDGRFANGEGIPQTEDLVLIMDAADAAKIFGGEMDAEAAFNAGALKIQGDLPDAIRVQELLEIVAEEIEYS